MNIAALSSQPPIVNGVLLTRLGDVHEWEVTATQCGLKPITCAAPVTAVQAAVHKLPLCKRCYPSYHAHGRADR